MTILVNILIVMSAFIGMEGVAWLAHKYVMHGLLWKVHKDHHQPVAGQTIEHNDFFFVLFALPAMVCFYFGIQDFGVLFWIAVGITLYGIAYFFVHDVFIHQRLKFLRHTDSVYFRAIRRAHKMHHKHLGKQEGECFGMLWAPLKYFREAKNAR